MQGFPACPCPTIPCTFSSNHEPQQFVMTSEWFDRELVTSHPPLCRVPVRLRRYICHGKNSFSFDTFSKMEVGIMHNAHMKSDTPSPTFSFCEPCFSVSLSFFCVLVCYFFCDWISVTVCLDLWLFLNFFDSSFLRLVHWRSIVFPVCDVSFCDSFVTFSFCFFVACPFWCDVFFLWLSFLSFLSLLLGQDVLISVARKLLV